MFCFSGRLVARSNVLLERIGDESVLLNLGSELYFGLDPVGTRMWQALTKAQSIEAAYEELLDFYEVDPERLRQDLEALIGHLRENGLVESQKE